MRSAILNIARSPQYQSWLKIGITFITGQGILQVLQLLTGLVVVRNMPIEQYAQYTIALALQSTALSLVEGGFASSIIDLVGGRVQNREVIGAYVKAAAYFRNRLLLIVGLIFSIVFFFITDRYNWSWEVRSLLLLSILLSLVFSAYINLYRPVLQIAKKFPLIYRAEIFQALLRLLCIGLLYLSVGLIAWQLALIGSLILLFRGVALQRSARDYMVEPVEVPTETKKEILRYVKPLLPGIVFAAFQGQITIFLVGIFSNTQAIAEVGALGRLSQIFLMFNMASGMLVIPYFARQSESGLLKKYISVIGLIFTILLSLIGFIYLFPDALLWILGEQYINLSDELLIMTITASVNVLNGVMWNMNKSRKWIYSWMPIVSIPGIIIIQILGIVAMDLSSAWNVLLLGLYTALFSLITRINVAFLGFKKIRRENY